MPAPPSVRREKRCPVKFYSELEAGDERKLALVRPESATHVDPEQEARPEFCPVAHANRGDTLDVGLTLKEVASTPAMPMTLQPVSQTSCNDRALTSETFTGRVFREESLCSDRAMTLVAGIRQSPARLRETGSYKQRCVSCPST